ncbi:MAG: response regulator [Chloroflexi bacterium]|nr:response regulator [Chloroflexota bacterium]
MVGNKPTLLVVEDDLDTAEMLSAYFRVQGYEVITVNRGLDGVNACQAAGPQLAIISIRLPDIDGFEVVQRIRANRRSQAIPVIYLSERRNRADRLRALEIGVDDYITKPFDVQELRLRVRNALRRASQDTLTNTITGLPDGALVDERLVECMANPGSSLLVVSLENLDNFREAYGFVAADDVLRAVSLMIHNAMREAESEADFLGHLGPSEFIMVLKPGYTITLRERIHTRLEQSLDYFYPIRDRENATHRKSSLDVRIGLLQVAEGGFPSLEQLKAALQRAKG